MNVLIADDCKSDRDWLAGVFRDRFPELLPVYEADNGREAVAKCLCLNPAVVVLDFQMPELDGVKAAEEILRTAPATPIIIFSSETDNPRIQRFAQRMVDQQNSAFTFLAKTATLVEVAAAIAQVLKIVQ